MQHVLKIILLTGLLSMWSSTLLASEKAWQALQRGEAVVLMRHAYAPDTNEVSPFNPDKCAAQRNISAGGANQARAVADTLRANSINEATVHSSSLCRCMDTGTLLEYGEVLFLPEIDTYFADRTKEPAQTAALRRWIKAAVAEKRSPTILVTHGFNIIDLMGSFVEQGEVLIVGVQDDALVVLHKFSTAVE